jgi:hypothetical protein
MVGTTDGVLTEAEAEHLVDEQPVAVSRENPEAAF